MASAKDYLAKGDRSAAVIELKNVLQKTPDNGEARLLLGQALFDAGDYVSAEKELSRALELKQPQEKVLPLYVRTLLALGNSQAVINEVAKYKLFDPAAVAETQTALGDAFRNLGNAQRAREAYTAALAAVPGFARARLGNAIVAAAEGNVDEALQQAEEIIAADPKLAEARAFRAGILLAKGDQKGARKALEEAIAVDERQLPSRLALISLLTDDGDFEAATKLLDTTRKVAPNDLQVTYLDALLAYRKGDRERARQQLQQLLKFRPDHVPSLVLAGANEFQSKQFAAAEVHLRQAVARAPGNVMARRLLVVSQLRLGQPARASETLQPLLEGGMSRDQNLLLLAGETYLANGDVKRATGFYQAASAAGEARAVVAKTRLGQVALATGRPEEGFKELEAASELDAGQYQADLAIINGHLSRNEVDKALKAAEALEKKQPKNPLTFQVLGLINLTKRDLPAARRGFEKALELKPRYLPAALGLADLDLTEGKPEDARKRFEAMIAKDSGNEQLYLALADLLNRTGADQKDVGQTLQRAVAANPQSVAARRALLNFFERNKDLNGALAAAQDAVAAIPGDQRLLFAAGALQEAAGQVNQAIETYNKLASLQPDSIQPLYRLAALYLRQKDFDKAIDTLRRAQRVAPKEQDVVLQLVQVYMAAKQPDEALKEARALQKRDPKFVGGYSIEGEIYFAQGKYADAERLYREALKVEPGAGAIAVRLHAVLVAAGKKAEADAWAKKWISENPKDVAMRLHLAQREMVAKNFKASAAHYQAAIAIDPDNAFALNNLAWISGELGDPKALGYAERALKLAPNSPAALDTYGMLLVRKGEAEKALPYLERARTMAPASNDLRLNYAKALIKTGRKDDARRELEALQGVKDNFAGKDEVAGLLKGL